MSIGDLIVAIGVKHKAYGITIHPPATQNSILNFEEQIGFPLPPDFREFYSYCNGLECLDNIFNFISLEKILENKDYGPNWFDFAEYMIYADTWSCRKGSDNHYVIFNTLEKGMILSDSLAEYLHRFLIGDVFGQEGLYAWHIEKGAKEAYKG